MRAPGSPNTPAHTCSKRGTHMLNSGSPRYERLGVGVGALRVQAAAKIHRNLCVPPSGPHLRLRRSQQQVQIPTPNSLALGGLLSITSASIWGWGIAPPPRLLPGLLPLVLSLSDPF